MIDIAPYVGKTDVFRYVRLTDLGTHCRGRTPGADIDAIAAIAYSWQFIEDDTTTVFFDFAKSELKAEAKKILDKRLAEFDDLGKYKLQIVGHTDAVGSVEDNQLLSENRAASVANYILSKTSPKFGVVTPSGQGELRPMVPNDTEDDRAINRRVELTFSPLKPCS